MAGCLIFLTGALAVARDEILQAIVVSRDILRFLFVLTTNPNTPSNLLADVLSCLMTLSEENLEFGQKLVADQETHCYKHLLKLKDSGSSRAMLACGVLHNVYFSLQWQDNSPGVGDASDALLVPSIAKVLEQTALSQATNGNHAADPADVLQIAFEVLASIGADLQSAIERGNKNERKPKSETKEPDEWNGIEEGDPMEEDEANEPATGNDVDNEDEGSDDGSDDEMDEDELEEDMELVTGADDDLPEESSLDDLPTLKSLIQLTVPQCIKWSSIALDNDEAIAVQSHALSSLNNIAWTVSCFDFANGENPGIYRAWAPAARKIWLKSVVPVLESDTADLKLATVVTSLAWAVSRSLGGNTPLMGDEHRKFMALYQASKGSVEPGNSGPEDGAPEDPFQGLGVKCIGVLGQLARDPAPSDLNREIGIFLLTVLSGLPATPAADAIETLNQLFDIYGDENAACDKAVFWKDGFLKHLEDITPKVKAMAKGIDKRRFGELRDRADEAVLNLGRFVRYKRNNAPK
jgi:hypothetical protein